MFKKNIGGIFLAGLVLFALSLTSSAVFAGSVSLSWDPTSANTDGAPIVNLAGYKVYSGTSPGVYTSVANAGLSTSLQLPNLTDGRTYYFSVTSYTTTGSESGYSNEVSKIIPLPAPTTTQYILSVAKTGTGTGLVTSLPGTISCGTVCSSSYTSGAVVTLTPAPNANSLFTGWSGACGGTDACTVTMNSALSVSANFAIKTYTITPFAGTGGAVAPSTTVTVNYGSTGNFTMSPMTGYRVADVLVNGISAGAVTSYTFTNVTSNQTIRALFDPVSVEPVAGTRLRCTDGGLPCVERLDGGSDGDNMVSGKPKADITYRFKATTDKGLPVSATLFLSQRLNPGTGDFASYPMVCAADASGSAACGFTTKLGPAATHRFSIEAEMPDGTVLRYPAAGTATGPQVRLLNGYSLVGIPRDINAANLDGKTATGSPATFRLSADGKYVSVKTTSPARTGEGFYSSNSNQSLPEHALFADIGQASYSIPLVKGWNIISNPYITNIRLADILVARGNELPVSWRTAVLNGWIANGLFTYDGRDWGGGYSAESDEIAVLAPWMGYMVSVNNGDAAYSLVIRKP